MRYNRLTTNLAHGSNRHRRQQPALDMIACGVPANDIIEAIGVNSPDIAGRKGRQAMGYARRTVARALQHATTS